MVELPVFLRVVDRSYEIEVENVTKTTSSVRIRKGKVVLKLSRFVRGKKRDEMVEKFLKWAEKRLVKVSGSDFINPVYENGGRICTHNKIYELNVYINERKNSRSILKDGNIIEIYFGNDMSGADKKKKMRFFGEKVIIGDQTPYLKEVLDELNQLYFQENYNLCRFKRMNPRFGSCSGKRNINIAYRLLFAPREVFRYVCVHELAHLKEFNHSKKFWNLIAQSMTDYRKHEKWLKDSGFMLG